MQQEEKLWALKISFKNKGKIKIFSDKVERTYHQQIYTIRKVKCSLSKKTLYKMDIWDLEKREKGRVLETGACG